MWRAKSKSTLLAKLLMVVGILALAGVIFLARQTIIDHINYLTYRPSTEIASFAKTTTMTSEGQFLFYSAHPALLDRTEFNKACPSYSPSIAILGCYDGEKIYIYDITNASLPGIREETAAYEMLHAAYKRLSDSDRAKLDKLIEAEYAKQRTTDTDASLAYFQQYEPGERDDELFSVIATQFKSVSPQLETYYNRYFNNREALVALYDQYQGVFSGLRDQANSIYTQLTTLSKTIDTENKQYTADSSQLQTDISSFNTKAANGKFTSQAEFDSTRAALVARSQAVEAERNQLNSDIDFYNTQLTTYNSLLIQVKSLQNSIDSNIQPAPSV